MNKKKNAAPVSETGNGSELTRRRTIKVNRDDLPWITIGRCGSHGTREIIFDFSELVKEFGTGDFSLLFVRPSEPDKQPIENITVPLSVSGHLATWTVSEHDTEKLGRGAGQIVYCGDGFRYRSSVFQITVLRSI